MFNDPSIVASKTCLQCEETLKGRSDKKFCSDYCRSSYNNLRYAKYNIHMRRVNERLRNNHRIMITLLGDREECWVSETSLAHAGFQFQFYTHVHLHDEGALFRVIYDCCYTTPDRVNYYIARRVPEHLTVVSFEKKSAIKA
jgi:predicted nucleic acid-binding Zn ribbon protein